MKKMMFFAVMSGCCLVASAAPDAPAKAKEAGPEVAQAKPAGPAALYEQANMYYRGRGAKRDYAKALVLYQQAAKEGHTAAALAVGFMCEHGQGTKVDYAMAMQWYKFAAAKGYANAQKAIGDLYRKGRGVTKDDAAAAQWYAKAADQDLAEAQCELGYLTIRGRGVPQDMAKAKKLLEEGAAQNNACSQHYLAFMYRHGLAGLFPDTEKAAELDKIAASNGNAEAQYNTAKLNELGWTTYATRAEALAWYRHSAEGGYPMAMERLAQIYEKGEHGQKADPARAKAWREKARDTWENNWFDRIPMASEEIRFMPPK